MRSCGHAPIENAGCAIALLVIFLEDRARQTQAVRLLVLSWLAWLVRVVFHLRRLDFPPALRRRPVSKMAAPGLAGRQMRGSVAWVAG